ncbi:hypothetical protein [Paraburkholderia sp. C35]|uniref:hypothetical protein n=1 Tax=Paraburkholderia sp. C35 TaxID=2126993 RepID=UPI0013A57931|nr:hypothetical protein [Paraburkholderia sp. C35]
MTAQWQATQVVPVSTFEHVVPSRLLAQLNETINIERDGWRPRDGRRASDLARQFAELLRTTHAFSTMEANVRASARHWYTSTFGHEPHSDPLYVLRCVNRDMPFQSYLRHFDSHVLTLLISLQTVGEDKKNGDLVVRLKQRQRFSALSHFVIKSWLFVEHRLPLALRRIVIASDEILRGYVRIPCTPGNVYIFNGFITLHHNLNVSTGERRSLIIHYYDPEMAMAPRRLLRRVQTLIDRANYRF